MINAICYAQAAEEYRKAMLQSSKENAAPQIPIKESLEKMAALGHRVKGKQIYIVYNLLKHNRPMSEWAFSDCYLSWDPYLRFRRTLYESKACIWITGLQKVKRSSSQNEDSLSCSYEWERELGEVLEIPQLPEAHWSDDVGWEMAECIDEVTFWAARDTK